jgi:hypothetical protein
MQTHRSLLQVDKESLPINKITRYSDIESRKLAPISILPGIGDHEPLLTVVGKLSTSATAITIPLRPLLCNHWDKLLSGHPSLHYDRHEPISKAASSLERPVFLIAPPLFPP